MITTHSLLRAGLVGLALLLLPACSSEQNDPGDAQTGSDACVGRGCDSPDASGDTDVPDGSIGSGCESNDDCTAGVCDPAIGRCVAPCLGDNDCGPTLTCATDGLCVSRAACSAGDSCGAGEACNTCLGVCQASAATTVCSSDTNCGFDEFCETCLGRCLPRRELCDPCSEDRECGESGDLCLDYAGGGRYCGRRCGACPVGYTCSESLGQCVALSGDCEQVRQCETSANCPAGQVCSPAFLCVVGCTGDESCTAGNVCQGGECRPPCTSSAECTAPAECTEGKCRVPGGCLTSEECLEPQTYCDRATAMCVPGCEVDNDCLDATLECIGGSCEPRGCRGNWSCSFGQVCDLATGLCAEATGPYCDSCNGDDVNSCGATSVCAGLQDDEGVDQGAFCFVACADDPDNRCPQGYRCQEVEIEAGDVRNVCTRPCFREPV